jgi:hypothetical protein
MCNMGPETEPFTHQRKVQNIGNTISLTDKQLAGPHKNSKNHIYEQHGFFSIVTFLGWTRLHATWIKPEVVAIKTYTGYLHYRFITTGSRFIFQDNVYNPPPPPQKRGTALTPTIRKFNGPDTPKAPQSFFFF